MGNAQSNEGKKIHSKGKQFKAESTEWTGSSLPWLDISITGELLTKSSPASIPKDFNSIVLGWEEDNNITVNFTGASNGQSWLGAIYSKYSSLSIQLRGRFLGYQSKQRKQEEKQWGKEKRIVWNSKERLLGTGLNTKPKWANSIWKTTGGKEDSSDDLTHHSLCTGHLSIHVHIWCFQQQYEVGKQGKHKHIHLPMRKWRLGGFEWLSKSSVFRKLVQW